LNKKHQKCKSFGWKKPTKEETIKVAETQNKSKCKAPFGSLLFFAADATDLKNVERIFPTRLTPIFFISVDESPSRAKAQRRCRSCADKQLAPGCNHLKGNSRRLILLVMGRLLT
jgi:hypothetical protein